MHNCAICKNHKPFDFPDELLKEIVAGEAVLFSGSGISTESNLVLHSSFYRTIAGMVGKSSSGLSFPELMTLFCAQQNGRIRLIQELRNRLNTIDAFPDLHRNATRFHRELGTVHSIKDIITTNWDTYFEDICMATPFVSDEDLAFWSAAKRRVLKIHGSINNLGSIVATTDDYDKCQRRMNKGVIGSFLKSLLATKTVIFIGYSFGDSDFQSIYKFIKKQMGIYHRQAYVVTPFEDEAAKFAKNGLIPICTDGTYFIHKLKLQTAKQGYSIPDDTFEIADSFLEKLYRIHYAFNEKFNYMNYPESLICSSYQDGLIHSLERARNRMLDGSYSCPHCLRSLINSYISIRNEEKSKKKYYSTAYVIGYIAGLFLILTKSIPPIYFAFGSSFDLTSELKYRKYLRNSKLSHKPSIREAMKIIKHNNADGKIIIQHRPEL